MLKTSNKSRSYYASIRILQTLVVFICLVPVFIIDYLEGFKGSTWLNRASNFGGICSIGLIFSLSLVPAKKSYLIPVSASDSISLHRIFATSFIFFAFIHVFFLIWAEPISIRYLTSYADPNMIFGCGGIVLSTIIFFSSKSIRNISILHKSRKNFKKYHFLSYFISILLIFTHAYYSTYSENKRTLRAAILAFFIVCLGLAFIRLKEKSVPTTMKIPKISLFEKIFIPSFIVIMIVIVDKL